MDAYEIAKQIIGRSLQNLLRSHQELKPQSISHYNYKKNQIILTTFKKKLLLLFENAFFIFLRKIINF